MNDSTVSIMQDRSLLDESEPRDGTRTWLLLIHQLPAEPAYLRVKVLRRLKSLGAFALKNSVYVLPAGDETREDFQWLRREIVGAGGDATLSHACFLEGTTDGELEEAFEAERNAEYAAFVESVRNAESREEPTHAELERLRKRLDAITQRDHFGAAGRFAAARAVSELEGRIRGDSGVLEESVMAKPVSATWVTRAGARVDRMSSAWLIRRFIDLAATFKFVSPDGYVPEEAELRFDMFEGEFTHEGDRCTFEVLVERFGLDAAGLRPIAEIIHDIDCKDERYGRPETAGVASVVRGIAAAHARDEDRLVAAFPVFDALFAQFQSERRGS